MGIMSWVFHWGGTVPKSKRELIRERRYFWVFSEDFVMKE